MADAAAAQPWEQLPVVDALLAHERALCEFARRELAGEADAIAPILTLPHVAAFS